MAGPTKKVLQRTGASDPAVLCADYYDWCLALADRWRADKDSRGFLGVFEAGLSGQRRAHERNVFVERHLPAARHLLSAPREPRVLDCACGTGYQAMLFALLGARVTAVEVYDKSVAIARRLAAALAAEQPNLAVDIHHRDLFAFLAEGRRDLAGAFDLIWVSEAISHIHPLEDFLPAVRHLLAPRGWLAVCESNVSNPAVRLKIDRERREAYAKRKLSQAAFREKDYWLFPARYADPVTGREVVQTNERMLSPRALKRLLVAAGYRDFNVHYRTFVPPQLSRLLGPSLVRPLEGVLAKAPLLRQLGIRYLFFAR